MLYTMKASKRVMLCLDVWLKHHRAEQHFPQSATQKVQIKAFLWGFSCGDLPPCMYTWGKNSVLGCSSSLWFFALICNLLIVFIGYNFLQQFFIFALLSRWWELYRWFKSRVMLRKIGKKDGKNSEFVFIMLTIIHFALKEYWVINTCLTQTY